MFMFWSPTSIVCIFSKLLSGIPFTPLIHSSSKLVIKVGDCNVTSMSPSSVFNCVFFCILR